MQRHNIHRDTCTASYAKARANTFSPACMHAHALTLINSTQADGNPPPTGKEFFPSRICPQNESISPANAARKRTFQLILWPQQGSSGTGHSPPHPHSIPLLPSLGPFLTTTRRDLKSPKPIAGTNHEVSTLGSPLGNHACTPWAAREQNQQFWHQENQGSYPASATS